MDSQLFGESIRIISNSINDDFYLDYIKKNSDDPIMILNVGDIVKKIENWAFKLPRVRPFYAMKCNTNGVVLKLLASLGCGFDCASKEEMRQIIGLGVSPSNIIYAHPCKPKSHIEEAVLLGVDKMTFDNEDELFKIKSIYPNASLLLRIRYDAKKSLVKLGVKFGTNPENAPLLLKTAKFLGLNIIGVSFHIGSNCQDPLEYFNAIATAREAFNEAIYLGFSPYLLDIGGGFPGNSDTCITEIAKYINFALDEYFPENNIQVIAEPGRYVVASAFTLLSPITSRRKIMAENRETEFMYYVNDGIHSTFAGVVLFNQTWKPIPLIEEKSEEEKNYHLYPSQIWGATCNSLDKISNLEMLPELSVGDWLMWKDMGAYTLSFQTNFNGFPSPKLYAVTSHRSWKKMQKIIDEKALQLAEKRNSQLHITDYRHHLSK